MKRTNYTPTIALLLLGFLAIPFAVLSADTETAPVQQVVDGDTLLLATGERVRLIGIDAPERRVNPKAKKDAQRSGEDIETIIAMGKKSTRFVESLVHRGDRVTLEFDLEKRDRYGRLLAYVHLSNGKMLNEEIVKAGYASLMTHPPNVKYEQRFLKAYREARENRRGLWK